MDTTSDTPVTLSRHRPETAIRGTDAIELGEGIMITREQVVFPSKTDSDKEEKDDDRGLHKQESFVL